MGIVPVEEAQVQNVEIVGAEVEAAPPVETGVAVGTGEGAAAVDAAIVTATTEYGASPETVEAVAVAELMSGAAKRAIEIRDATVGPPPETP